MTDAEYIDLIEERCKEYLHVIRTGEMPPEMVQRAGKKGQVPTLLQMQEAIYHLTGAHTLLMLIECYRKVHGGKE
jgi:hypothetical protein